MSFPKRWVGGLVVHKVLFTVVAKVELGRWIVKEVAPSFIKQARADIELE